MKELYVYHHLGIGDHIICNGLVRHYREKCDSLGLFCLEKNYENASYLFRDDPAIFLVPQKDDKSVQDYIFRQNIPRQTLIVGFDRMGRIPSLSFDEDLYQLAGVPFEYRFSKFFFQRDSSAEDAVCAAVNPAGEKYIFVHGNINLDKVRKDRKIIFNPVQFRLLDIIKLLEGAEEIHLEESSVKCLVNSVPMSKPKIFFHKYARINSPYLNSKGINHIEEVE